MGMLPKDYKRPSTSKYVKLGPGNNVLRILAEPIFGYEGWAGTKEENNLKPVRKHAVTDFLPGEVNTEGKNKIRHFWAMPVWNYAANAVHVWQITQVSIMDGITVLDNNAKWGDARGYDLCIVKEGDGLDTEYTVMPEPKSDLPREAAEAWELVRRTFDINALFENRDPFDPDGVPF